MHFNGFQWISLDFNVFQWHSIDFKGFQWNSIDFADIQWFQSIFMIFKTNQFFGVKKIHFCPQHHGVNKNNLLVSKKSIFWCQNNPFLFWDTHIIIAFEGRNTLTYGHCQSCGRSLWRLGLLSEESMFAPSTRSHWILTIFNGFQWNSNDSNGIQWNCMTFNRFQWISMNFTDIQ